MSANVKTVGEALEYATPALLNQYLRDKDDTHVFAPMIEGPPGIGKSVALNDFAKKLGIKKIVSISCGVIDPNLEFIGLPEIVKDGDKGNKLMAYVKETNVETGETKILDSGSINKVYTKWIKPERIGNFDDLEDGDRGLLVFDDVHFLLQQQQAMLMQLLTNAMTIHTHKIG